MAGFLQRSYPPRVAVSAEGLSRVKSSQYCRDLKNQEYFNYVSLQQASEVFADLIPRYSFWGCWTGSSCRRASRKERRTQGLHTSYLQPPMLPIQYSSNLHMIPISSLYNLLESL